MSKIGIIIAREFNERVRKKAFIVTTILMPVLLIGLMVVPAIIMNYSQGETRRIAVIDNSGLVMPRLVSDQTVLFEPTELELEQARQRLDDRFGVLWIGENVLEKPTEIRLYTNGASALTVEQQIEQQVKSILEGEKLKAYRIDNLSEILEAVRTPVHMQVFRNDEAGDKSQSSVVATAVGFVLGMVLYMFLLMYGAMVMQSVIDEKQSRVLELMVSSVRPFDLMMGKILGIASVAVVQILIWAVLVVGVSVVVMPHLVPAEVMESAQAMQTGGMVDAEAANTVMLQAVAAMTDLGYILKLFLCLVLYVVGGYLLYSAMFAAIGASVDNIQDSQQLQLPVTVPIIVSIFVMMSVMNNPTSGLVFWCSMIPFTSPVVMMARIPYGIPLWEIALSLVLLYGTFVGMVALSAKIYRVGIFMYGKKPTFKELYKWIRYK